MNVVILHDEMPPNARPDELDALEQARVFQEVLTPQGHRCDTLAATLNLEQLAQSLIQLKPHLVVNLVESLNSRGQFIHFPLSLLDSLKIPYTGNRTEAMFLTSHKVLAKQILSAHGIATPPWHTIASLKSQPTTQGRYIIKSVWEEASVGLDDIEAVVQPENSRQLDWELFSRADMLGGEAFAEAYISGREFNLALLADGTNVQLLPPAEIQFVGYSDDRPKIVGYRAKWQTDSFEYNNTPRRFDFPESDTPLLHALAGIARQCWDVLNLNGYARVDFRVDEQGRPWVLEINANPCLSPDAGFMAAATCAGLTVTEVVQRIVADALKDTGDPHTAYRRQ